MDNNILSLLDNIATNWQLAITESRRTLEILSGKSSNQTLTFSTRKNALDYYRANIAGSPDLVSCKLYAEVNNHSQFVYTII